MAYRSAMDHGTCCLNHTTCLLLLGIRSMDNRTCSTDHRACSVDNTTCSMDNRPGSIVHRPCSIDRRTCSQVHRTHGRSWSMFHIICCMIHRTCSLNIQHDPWTILHVLLPTYEFALKSCSIVHRACSINLIEHALACSVKCRPCSVIRRRYSTDHRTCSEWLIEHTLRAITHGLCSPEHDLWPTEVQWTTEHVV